MLSLYLNIFLFNNYNKSKANKELYINFLRFIPIDFAEEKI